MYISVFGCMFIVALGLYFLWLAFITGRKYGMQKGYDRGYSKGYNEGYQHGWDARHAKFK